MKHYVMGLVFNYDRDRVLLIEKLRPEWMKGRWNGIGGKIDDEDGTPMAAMHRESKEECGHSYLWKLKVIFTCPGGTVYVYAAIYPHNIIDYKQMEDEKLQVFELSLVPDSIMSNLKVYIPLCLSSFEFPILINQLNLGVQD